MVHPQSHLRRHPIHHIDHQPAHLALFVTPRIWGKVVKIDHLQLDRWRRPDTLPHQQSPQDCDPHTNTHGRDSIHFCHL
ncbi:hypothetical protein [Aeromonas veronii]|uniref:hypothetical protein n=1 Tax=Aeromonas veronii TaxID=654 RepID=UPI00351ACEFA